MRLRAVWICFPNMWETYSPPIRVSGIASGRFRCMDAGSRKRRVIRLPRVCGKPHVLPPKELR